MMGPSIIKPLVLKDFEIMRTPILCWWTGGLLATALPWLFAGERVFMASLILFVTAMAGAGFHGVMQTVVEERREKTLPFIMSLPITVREYTSAKLVANLTLFAVVWITLSAASLVVAVGTADSPLAKGTIPFISIVLVGILLAYTIVLTTSLVSESIGVSIAAIVIANIATQIFLWWIASLDGIRSTMGAGEAVWSRTALIVLGGQLLAVVGLLWLTYILQARKRDFI